VRLSDSFRTTISELAGDLGAVLYDWSPTTGDGLPAGVSCILVLAGGAENLALDLFGSLPQALPRYVVGASPDHRIASAVILRGARDYFALPDDLGLLRRSLERERGEAAGRTQAARFAEDERRLTGFDVILGDSEVLRRTIDQARRAAQHKDVTVLIGGETGTGKELLARALHYDSPRAAAPFVEINCAAIPANLLESELFGHEKGSFTGATSAKPGLLEMGNGGTVFLDEIGHLPLELQPKLLRALENREIRRVGGQQTRKVDVRVVAATHIDLAAAVGRGEFREDLFYRLNVVALVLPPLRERGEDVVLLAQAFVERLAKQYEMPTPPISEEAQAALRALSWPGNVRELRNVIERALVLSPPGTLQIVEPPSRRAAAATRVSPLPFPATLKTITQSAANAMLALVDGNKSEAARRLGISRPRLLRILNGKYDDE
jgi:two-component system response regulator HydG